MVSQDTRAFRSVLRACHPQELGGRAYRIRQIRAVLALGLLIVLALASPSRASSVQLPGSVGVNPVGAATYSIPIDVPPGTLGMAPTLSLSYNSQAGDGPLGLGWAVSGVSTITRCASTVAQDGVAGAVHNDANDRFCLDGRRLMVSSGTYGANAAQYRTEIDSYTVVTEHGSISNGTAWFSVQTNTG